MSLRKKLHTEIFKPAWDITSHSVQHTDRGNERDTYLTRSKGFEIDGGLHYNKTRNYERGYNVKTIFVN